MKHNKLKGTTPVPNSLFDVHLPRLKPAELKLLLVVVRQTLGWVDTQTGKRKQRDWISNSQLIQKTGCSKRALSDASATLLGKGLIEVSGLNGNTLDTPESRKGKLQLFYKPTCGNVGDYSSPKAESADHDQQDLLITKATDTKKSKHKTATEFYFTESDIKRFRKELSEAGSIEKLLLDKEAITQPNGNMEVVITPCSATYRKKHLSENSFPGLRNKNLRTPYSIWMTLFHHCYDSF